MKVIYVAKEMVRDLQSKIEPDIYPGKFVPCVMKKYYDDVVEKLEAAERKLAELKVQWPPKYETKGAQS